MPELPDLEYVVPRLQEALTGKRIVRGRVKEPIVLRVAVPGDLPSLTAGKAVREIERRAQFVRFVLDDLELVVNLMLAGRFRLAAAGDKDERTLCFALEVEGGVELRYLDEKRMGKAYVIPPGRHDLVPGFMRLGVEILSPEFTRAHFLALAAKRRDQVRAFLLDKSALAAIGNAYADEILWAAKIHPKTFVRQLAPEELGTLYDAILEVTRAAAAEVARREAPIEEKVRDFLQVRGKKGAPCPRCGATLRRAIVRSADTVFCPVCQPARRNLFVDWRKVSKPTTSTSPEPKASARSSSAGPPASSARPASGRRPSSPPARGRRRPPRGG